MLKSSNRIRHETPSTARWWAITSNCPVGTTHSALTMTPAAGFSRARASMTASSDSSCTARRHSRASTEPASGTVSDQPPASSSTRSRSMACRSRTACNTATTSSSVTPTGACTSTVWLN